MIGLSNEHRGTEVNRIPRDLPMEREVMSNEGKDKFTDRRPPPRTKKGGRGEHENREMSHTEEI